jgi:hypothetical protein
MIMHRLHSVHYAQVRETAQRVEKVVIFQSPPISGAPKPEMDLSRDDSSWFDSTDIADVGSTTVRPGRFQLS